MPQWPIRSDFAGVVRCVFAISTEFFSCNSFVQARALSGAADAHTVQAIAQRAGSQCFDCNRGPFHVLEVWVEKETMVEILPPEYMRGNILPSTGLIMSGRP